LIDSFCQPVKQEHTAAIKAHAKAVETEHKLAAKLNQLQHEHEAALSREQKLAKVRLVVVSFR
jgi:hypothetical protein